ncbi:MAG TPA: glycoside hydrolase family 18 protein [Steroidobacteraceae bacterium]|nr:glycoside hydrolase family 18 protein [Steroidobacteraceae bacterium]
MIARVLPGLLLGLIVSSIPAEAAPRIAAYYDGGMPVSAIPADKLSELIYAFGEPNDAGSCAAPTAAQIGTFAALRDLRRQHPGLRLILSIGGWDAAPQYSDIALTDRTRRRFTGSCIQIFVVQQGFDGIDLDWEFPVHGGMNKSRSEDRADATALVREFRRQLDALGHDRGRHYLLTVATPAGTWQQGGAYSVSDSYDLAALAPAVDWLNVMTYDMNNIFSPASAFNAPLAADPRDPAPAPQRARDNLTSAVRYYESQGVPAAKIMLGVAFYGRGFTGVSPQDGGLYSKYKDGFPETPWKTVSAHFLTSPDWVRHWSASAQAPWLYNARQHIFFTYDDPRSLAIKADFARREHLRGAMIWVLGEDDPGNCLLNALTSHLDSESPPQDARH